MKKILWALFALYAAVMLYLLFARQSLNTGAPYWQQVKANLNLKPLQTIRHQFYLLNLGRDWATRSGVVNIYGNIIVFIPLGFCLPRLISVLQKLWRTLLVCTGLITLVEITQLLTLRGYGDVDDLLLNLLGCALGYGIYTLFPKAAPPQSLP